MRYEIEKRLRAAVIHPKAIERRMNVGWNQRLKNMTRAIHFRHIAIILTSIVDSLVRLSYSQTPPQLLNAYCPFRWQSASGLPDT